MTARTMPTLPSPLAGQKNRASYLTQLITWENFWANRPMFSMQHTVGISVGNNAYTQIPMSSLDRDTDSGRAGVTPYAYTIPAGFGGAWRFAYKVSWAVSTAGDRLVALYKNGVIVSSGQNSGLPTTASHNGETAMTRTIVCAAGDVMSIYALQSSGGSLSTNSGMFEGCLDSLASP